MKILILGGTKFFGKETAKLLAGAGHEVTVFSRRAPIPGLPLDITQTRGDRTVEADLVRMSTTVWDAVIDNICYTADDAQKAVRVFSGRTGLYIFTSSSSVYSLLQGAASPFREIQTEVLPLRPVLGDKPYISYAKGKYEAEKVFLAAAREKKFPVVMLRPPVVIGPEDPTLRAYSYWLRLGDGGPIILPNPSVRARYVFSKDLARVFLLLLSDDTLYGQALNIGDSGVLSLEDLVKLSARIMHKDADIVVPEHSWLKANSFNFEASPFSGAADFIVDISRAEKTLGWRSTEAHAWLEESINWFFLKYGGPRPDNYASRKSEMELARRWREGER